MWRKIKDSISGFFLRCHIALLGHISEAEGRKAYWTLRAYGASRHQAARAAIALAEIPATDAHGRRFRLGMLREALADTVD